jgi:hypothetical protein
MGDVGLLVLENALEDHVEGKAPLTTEEARKTLERLMTVSRTCRIRGLNFVEVVRDALRGKGNPGFGAP